MEKLKNSNKRETVNLLKNFFDSISKELNEEEKNPSQSEMNLKKRLDSIYKQNEEILNSVKYSEKKLLSLSECSEYFKISKSLLYKKTSKKELPFYKFGGIIFFQKEEIIKLIQSNPQLKGR